MLDGPRRTVLSRLVQVRRVLGVYTSGPARSRRRRRSERRRVARSCSRIDHAFLWEPGATHLHD